MKTKKKKSWKRELAEWGVFLGIIAILYTTGLHTPVLGFVQGLVLKTGLVKPDIDAGNHYGQLDDDFDIVDSAGETVSFSAFDGQVVFINFWATWCPPCIAEMPDIQDLYEAMGDQEIKFVIISLDDDFDKAKAFVERKGYTFPIYAPHGALPQVLQSQSIPTTFVIDRQRNIVVKRQGMAKYNSQRFRNYLAKLAEGG
jgi:peroxiredoxin